MSLVIALRGWLNVPLDDEALMQHYAETGNADVLTRLYDRRANDLFHYLLALCGQQLAQDIAQKTWLKVIEKRHLYRPQGRFKSWLFTLGRRTLLDELRKPTHTSLDSPDHLADTAIPTLDNGLQEAFGNALNALPFEQRDAFCLQQEGFGLQEIATLCDVGTETIKSRLRYARRTLKAKLENYHD